MNPLPSSPLFNSFLSSLSSASPCLFLFHFPSFSHSNPRVYFFIFLDLYFLYKWENFLWYSVGDNREIELDHQLYFFFKTSLLTHVFMCFYTTQHWWTTGSLAPRLLSTSDVPHKVFQVYSGNLPGGSNGLDPVFSKIGSCITALQLQVCSDYVSIYCSIWLEMSHYLNPPRTKLCLNCSLRWVSGLTTGVPPPPPPLLSLMTTSLLSMVSNPMEMLFSPSSLIQPPIKSTNKGGWTASCSWWLTILTGVPQGTIIGPNHFLRYNDALQRRLNSIEQSFLNLTRTRHSPLFHSLPRSWLCVGVCQQV